MYVCVYIYTHVSCKYTLEAQGGVRTAVLILVPRALQL